MAKKKNKKKNGQKTPPRSAPAKVAMAAAPTVSARTKRKASAERKAAASPCCCCRSAPCHGARVLLGGGGGRFAGVVAPHTQGPCLSRGAKTVCDYVRQLPLHALRAFSNVDQKNLASPPEKRHLSHRMAIVERGTINTSVWRRSSMVVVIAAALVSFVFQAIKLAGTHAAYESLAATSQHNTTYGVMANDTASFRYYSRRVGAAMVASAVGRVAWARFVCEAVILGASALSVAMVAVALSRWDNYSSSRRMVLGAWVVVFVGRWWRGEPRRGEPRRGSLRRAPSLCHPRRPAPLRHRRRSYSPSAAMSLAGRVAAGAPPRPARCSPSSASSTSPAYARSPSAPRAPSPNT